MLFSFFATFVFSPPPGAPPGVGLSRRRPPLSRGPHGGPRPPRPAPGSSGGMDDAQSRREGPPAHPLRHGRPYRGTTSSGPPGDRKHAFGRGGRGLTPCRGRRGRKCGSLAGLSVQSASVMRAQRAAQTRPPDIRHIESRPPTLWPAPGGGGGGGGGGSCGGSGSWRRRPLVPVSRCRTSAWARMA